MRVRWSFTYDMLRHARKKICADQARCRHCIRSDLCSIGLTKKIPSLLPFSTIKGDSIADSKTLPEGLGA